MHDEAKKYLLDIVEAAKFLLQFSSGKNFADYAGDPLLRAAIERKFEIIGEAMSQLSKVDPATAAEFPDCPKIIAFRNLLIHAYSLVDDRVVWDALEQKLPVLLRQAEALLRNAEHRQ